MTNIFSQDVQEAINSLISFDAKAGSFEGSQSDYAKANIHSWHLAAKAVLKKIGKLQGKKRDAALIKMNLATLAGRANKDTRLAWQELGGKNGLPIVKLVEAGKVGGAIKVRGIVSKAKALIDAKAKGKSTPIPRKPKSGQGGKTVSFKTGKKATTHDQKLAVLEAAAQAHGFNLIDFFNEWSEEAAEPAQKIAANG